MPEIMPEIKLRKPCTKCDNTGYITLDLHCTACDGKGYLDNKDLYIRGIHFQQRQWQEKAHSILIKWSAVILLPLSRDIKYLIPTRDTDTVNNMIQELITKAKKANVRLPNFKHTGAN